MIGRLVSGARHMNGWHRAFALVLAVMLVVLLVRAFDEYRWSDWGFGDAQSMLSLRQWNEEGWFRNYFLFIPQGYAGIIRLLDDEPLRHHAHGTCPGSAPGVGPRLWYTHYPAGYLVPYAALFRLGVEGIGPMRALSVIMSLAAVLLMYLLFCRITGPAVAFVAAVFYLLSPTFLGYADTIANQPLDDLLRFGFMLAVVLSVRSESALVRRRWTVAAWLIEFALSLSSFDSVFFVYVWLIGWDLLDGRGVRLKRYLVFACAPVLAHSLQLLQNVWYLGFDTALKDVKVTFLQKSGADPSYGGGGGGRLATVLASLLNVLSGLYHPFWVPLAAALLYAVFRLLHPASQAPGNPSLKLIAVLFACGLAYLVVLPHGANMPYQGRQMLPAGALLASGLTVSYGRLLSRSMRGPTEGEAVRTPARRSAEYAYLAAAPVFLVIFWYGFFLLNRTPQYPIPDDKAMTSESFVRSMQANPMLSTVIVLKDDISLARRMVQMPTLYEPVYFDVGAFRSFWDPNYVPGFPQINPIVEFYAASRPVLCFADPESVVEDLVYMIRRGGTRFSPVLIGSDPGQINKALNALGQEGVIRESPENAVVLSDRYILDLTPYVNWEFR